MRRYPSSQCSIELSEYLWEDSSGTVHTIPQGEGGEQGDPLMPLLFAVGQHEALEAINGQLPEEGPFVGLFGRHVHHHSAREG